MFIRLQGLVDLVVTCSNAVTIISSLTRSGNLSSVILLTFASSTRSCGGCDVTVFYFVISRACCANSTWQPTLAYSKSAEPTTISRIIFLYLSSKGNFFSHLWLYKCIQQNIVFNFLPIHFSAVFCPGADNVEVRNLNKTFAKFLSIFVPVIFLK